MPSVIFSNFPQYGLAITLYCYFSKNFFYRKFLVLSMDKFLKIITGRERKIIQTSQKTWYGKLHYRQARTQIWEIIIALCYNPVNDYIIDLIYR